MIREICGTYIWVELDKAAVGNAVHSTGIARYLQLLSVAPHARSFRYRVRLLSKQNFQPSIILIPLHSGGSPSLPFDFWVVRSEEQNL